MLVRRRRAFVVRREGMHGRFRNPQRADYPACKESDPQLPIRPACGRPPSPQSGEAVSLPAPHPAGLRPATFPAKRGSYFSRRYAAERGSRCKFGTLASTLPGRVLKTMENRKQAILRAVVNEFTTSAVPVGSQALQSRYFVNLSSATIRSELAELADLGYLAQPHTSAGRVPTDSGYRYFVDFLMDLEPIPDSVSMFIREELHKAPADVQGMVEKVAMTLAAVTQNAAGASAPQGSPARIKPLASVSPDPSEVLLILLLEGNLLRQQVVTVTQEATQADLTLLTGKFNSTLTGRGGDEARSQYDKAALGLEKELLGRVVTVLDLYEQGSERHVRHHGIRHLLRQP